MTTEQKALAATHQCTICGALWRECDDFSWTLCSTRCGSCCDNVPMGSQIVSISEAHEADKKVFSEAITAFWPTKPAPEHFQRFILPNPEPDPLVEVSDAIGVHRITLEQALAARGYKIERIDNV